MTDVFMRPPPHAWVHSPHTLLSTEPGGGELMSTEPKH